MNLKRNLNVDILRSVALIYMIMYHVHVLTGIEFSSKLINSILSMGGEVGVSCFFVISGYSIYQCISKKYISYFDFLKGRFKRIAPHYYFSIFLVLFFTEGAQYLCKQQFLNIIAHLLFLHPLNPCWQEAISGVLWTMGVIFEFYMIAPFLKKIIDKYPKITLISSILLVVVAKFFIFSTINKNSSNSVLLFIYGRQIYTTINAFITGMLVAKIQNNYKLQINVIGQSMCLLGIFVLVLDGSGYISRFSSNSIYSFSLKGIFWHICLESIIGLYIFFSQKNTWNNLIKKILLFISRHEYSIYVWHLLLINKIVGYSPIYMTVRNNCPKLCFIIVFIIAMVIPYFIDLFISSIDYNQVKKQIINLK